MYSQADLDIQVLRLEQQDALIAWREAHELELSITAQQCDERIREYTMDIACNLREVFRGIGRLRRVSLKRISLWWNS